MSLHHTEDEICLLCEAKLTQAHETLARWFKERIKPSWPTAHISWSYRGKADQEKCVREGTSKLPWPKSAHNHRVPINLTEPYDLLNEGDANTMPKSLALDLFELVNGKALWRPAFFYEIQEDIEASGMPILWGGRWKELGDKDHYEMEPELPLTSTA